MYSVYLQTWNAYFSSRTIHGIDIVFAVVAFALFSFSISRLYKFFLEEYGKENISKIKDVLSVIWVFVFLIFSCFMFTVVMASQFVWY